MPNIATYSGALPATYRGLSFSTRLAARWAHYFDLGQIPWEYQPEAHAVYNRMYFEDWPDEMTGQPEGSGYPWVPDFWLPSLGVWATVQRSLDDWQGQFIYNAAACLKPGHGHEYGPSLILLGPWDGIPRGVPLALSFYKGHLYADCFRCVAPAKFCSPENGCYGLGRCRSCPQPGAVQVAYDCGDIYSPARSQLAGSLCEDHLAEHEFILANACDELFEEPGIPKRPQETEESARRRATVKASDNLNAWIETQS